MRAALAVLLLLAVTGPAAASGTTSRMETAGTGVAIALPLIAGGISLYKDDRTGLAELTVDTLATVGTAYALKNIVREQRPDKSDFQSFPSDTSALAFAPAQYLWDRYGWQYGLPAYAAASFVGYSRIDAKKHHWYDVAASAGFAFGFSKLFTTRYRAPGLRYGAEVSPDGGSFRISYNF
jgi:membrane-associated phospholipid phosphatase